MIFFLLILAAVVLCAAIGFTEAHGSHALEHTLKHIHKKGE